MEFKGNVMSDVNMLNEHIDMCFKLQNGKITAYYEFIELENRFGGIVYERVHGKTLLELFCESNGIQ